MKLTQRINALIDAAYAKNQTTVSTTLNINESLCEDEIDELITDLRHRGFHVIHDDVFNDLMLTLPKISQAEIARRHALNVESASRQIFQEITRGVRVASSIGAVKYGYRMESLSSHDILKKVIEDLRQEEFEVSIHIDTRYVEIQIAWVADILTEENLRERLLGDAE